MSLLASYFKQNQFCILVEYLTSQNIVEFKPLLAGYPTVMTLADRVQSDEDLSPIKATQNYPHSIDKVLHFSGKDRDIQDFLQFLSEAQKRNIINLLLLTGDKLKSHHFGDKDLTQRTRYLESVNAVMAAKEYGGFHIGVAFNPFKYADAEKEAQYLKLHKKIKAGADFIIMQLGYDIQMLKDAQQFFEVHEYNNKLVACVMPLNLARANYMLKNKVAGVVITPHMLNVLAYEKEAGIKNQAYLRCALQILIYKNMGYAGIHLSGCHSLDEQIILENYIQENQHLSLKELEDYWYSLWQVKSGETFIPVLSNSTFQLNSHQIQKYKQMDFIHTVFFNSKMSKGIGNFIFKSSFWDKNAVNRVLLKTEFMSKHRVIGCESCGQCRLEDTLYICPETCPKGLANGPCGGTTLDLCEFGDRECIHSVKVRLAKEVKQTQVLKEKLIATVPVEIRGTSSWRNWYLTGKN